MSYGRIARIYEWLERVSFGGRLRVVRESLLEDLARELGGGGRVLLVGDGDGRFLERLVEVVDGVRVDYVDSSDGMMRLARARVGDREGRVRYFTSDVRDWESVGYDAVVSHFFLDCFEGEELAGVVRLLVGSVREGGVVVVSDFDPSVGWWARGVVWVMGLFFRVAAGMRITKVLNYSRMFEAMGLKVVSEMSVMRGFIYSVMLQKN